MKKLILLPILLVAMIAAAQDDAEITVCHTPATEQFAMLSLEDGFYEKHDLPADYIHESKSGKMISFPVENGEDGKAFELKASSNSNSYLFVIHEWWGLNEHIKKEAERFYNEIGNVNVLALDLYDGKVATTREDAGKYMRGAQTARLESIIRGAVAYAGENARIATIGWCFGGGWSLQSALLSGEQSIGCVIYYGMPEKDVEKLKTLNSDVLGIFAAQEQWINPQVVKEFEENMEKAGKSVTVHSFEANHGFANPSSQRYNEEAAQEANQLSLDYLKQKFQH